MRLTLFILLISIAGFSSDRIYTADEVSNTVTFIDTKSDKVVGLLQLGTSHPQHKAYMKNPVQMNVHGIDVAKTKKLIAVTSNLSNSVVIVDSVTAKPFKLLTVGRSPHISQFTPDESELWVSVRGESNIEIYDTTTWKLKELLVTDKGPSTVVFLKEKPYVFVANVTSGKLQVFDYKTRKLVKAIPTSGIFGATLQKTSDEKEIWLIEKDKGMVGRIDTEKLVLLEELKVGSFPQHVGFSKIADGGYYAYVTVGQDKKVVVYKLKNQKAEFYKNIPIDGVPHAVISVYDSKLYVNTEYGDEVFVFDIKNDFKKIGEMKIGQSPQAMTFLKDATEEGKEKDLKPLSMISESEKTIVLNSKFNLSVLNFRSLQVVDFIRLHVVGTTGAETVTAYRSPNFKVVKNVIDVEDADVVAKSICAENTCIGEMAIPRTKKSFDFKTDQSEYILVDDQSKVILAATDPNLLDKKIK